MTAQSLRSSPASLVTIKAAMEGAGIEVIGSPDDGPGDAGQTTLSKGPLSMTDLPVDELPAPRTDPAAQSGTHQAIPAETRALLGPAPITYLEDRDGYERILAQMAVAVSPQDFVEWIWVKDLVDLAWDAARARRAKSVRLALAHREGIESILAADGPGGLEGDLLEDLYSAQAGRIADRDRTELKTFAVTLKRLGLTNAAASDAAYHFAIDDIERLQRLIDNADSRRDAVLREIDRRREAFAKRARPAVEAMGPVIDAEFE